MTFGGLRENTEALRRARYNITFTLKLYIMKYGCTLFYVYHSFTGYYCSREGFLQTLVSSVSDSNYFDILMPQRITEPRKTGTSVLCRTKVRTLLNVLQGQHGPPESFHETKTPGIENENAPEAHLKDLPTEDHTVSSGEKSRQSLGGTGHKRPSPHGTAVVRPGMKTYSGIRCYGSGKRLLTWKKQAEQEEKRSESRREEVPASLDSPALVIGILAGILMLLLSLICVVLLW